MGSVAATDMDNSSQTNSTNLQVNSTADNISNSSNNDSTNASTEDMGYFNDCCSIVLHVSEGHDVYAYRRDSNYAADLYFQQLSFYGQDIIKEFKTVNGYFFHTIVSGDGWFVGTGGPDIPDLNMALENLAGGCFASNSITWATIDAATNILRQLGMGHFVIKSPSNDVGLSIVNGGTKTALFRLGDGQYVSVPNGPGYYRDGYTSTSDPVYSAIDLEITDGWGVNRRNIITYDVNKNLLDYGTDVKIWASNTRSSDNIIFDGQFISGGSLPGAPYRLFIGEKALKNNNIYFGYQSVIYMYSDILSNYNNSGVLPGSGAMVPWKILSDPNAGPYSNENFINAAIWVKNYIDDNYKLPDTVEINGRNVSINTYLYLASIVVQNIYNKKSELFYAPVPGAPQVSAENIIAGNMGISEYIKIADQVKVYMDRTGIVPGFAYGTSLGTYFGWQSMIYMYSDILTSYNATKSLPTSIAVKPWRIISDPNFATFTKDQVVEAAVNLKTIMDGTYQLPSTVRVNGREIGIYSFLYLLSFVVQNIYNNNNGTMDTWTFKDPESNNDDVRTGNMGINEYIHVADIAKVYMDRKGIVPGFAYGTSLGTYFGWKTMIYTFCCVLTSYNSTKSLPTSIAVKPWRIISDPNFAIFTKDQVVEAAINVKTQIDSTNQLPSSITINGRQIDMYSFLYLLSFVVQNIYNKNEANIDSRSFRGPEVQREDIHPGNMGLSEYIHIADVVKVYMDRTGYVPGYAYGTSLGTYFGWQSMIYMYSNILASYNDSKILSSSIIVQPWRFVSDPHAVIATNNQVITAAIYVNDYIEKNHLLPNTVDINGKQIDMYSFLYLLSFAVQNIYNNNPNSVYTMNFNGPQVQRDNIILGNMSKNEYIHIADVVKVYMDRTGYVPGYAYGTSLGTYFSWQSMIYMYSKILNSYNATGNLPSSIEVKPFSAAGGVISLTNVQVVDAAIGVKNQIDATYQLPSSVTINGIQIDMYSFLYLLSYVVQNLYNHNSDPFEIGSFNGPQVQTESIIPGYMSISEYIHIADVVKVYMDRTGYVPGYAYGTSLGTYFGWKSMIYMYSDILTSYNFTKTLPSSIAVKTWKIISDPNAITVTNNQVVTAAIYVKDYIQKNHQLPGTIDINGRSISIYTYLYLASTAVQNIYTKNTGPIFSTNYQAPQLTKDNIRMGSMDIARYINVADQIKVYMDNTGVTPGYVML